MDTCGYMGIHVDICGYMWIYIYVDICGYMWIHAVASRGGGAGGLLPRGPGQLWGPGPSWIFVCVDRKSVGDPGGDPGMIITHRPPSLNLSRY